MAKENREGEVSDTGRGIDIPTDPRGALPGAPVGLDGAPDGATRPRRKLYIWRSAVIAFNAAAAVYLELSATRFVGRVCETHPEFGGMRQRSTGRCTGCNRDMVRAYAKTEKGKAVAKNRERKTATAAALHARKMATDGAYREKRTRKVRERAQKLVGKTPQWVLDDPAQMKLLADIYAEAKRLGLHVDHIIPISHPDGFHEPGNLQLLTKAANLSKWNKYDPSDPERYRAKPGTYDWR